MRKHIQYAQIMMVHPFQLEDCVWDVNTCFVVHKRIDWELVDSRDQIHCRKVSGLELMGDSTSERRTIARLGPTEISQLDGKLSRWTQNSYQWFQNNEDVGVVVVIQRFTRIA